MDVGAHVEGVGDDAGIEGGEGEERGEVMHGGVEVDGMGSNGGGSGVKERGMGERKSLFKNKITIPIHMTTTHFVAILIVS